MQFDPFDGFFVVNAWSRGHLLPTEIAHSLTIGQTLTVAGRGVVRRKRRRIISEATAPAYPRTVPNKVAKQAQFEHQLGQQNLEFQPARVDWSNQTCYHPGNNLRYRREHGIWPASLLPKLSDHQTCRNKPSPSPTLHLPPRQQTPTTDDNRPDKICRRPRRKVLPQVCPP